MKWPGTYFGVDHISGEKEYYERQFATLRSFEEVDSIDSAHVIDEEQDLNEQVHHERAMKISNWANVFLLAFKVTFFFFLSFCSRLRVARWNFNQW